MRRSNSAAIVICTTTILLATSLRAGDLETFLLKDIHGGERDSRPSELTALGDLVVFSATDAPHGRELWKSDGTPEGTVLLMDIRGGERDSNPSGFTALGELVVFWATDASHGHELWKSDGTEAGTLMITDGTDGVRNLVSRGGLLYFLTRSPLSLSLWRSDGTADGTTLIRNDLPTCHRDPTDCGGFELETHLDKLFYKAEGRGHWVSDGTPEGTLPFHDCVEQTGTWRTVRLLGEANEILFVQASDAVHGAELWAVRRRQINFLRGDCDDNGQIDISDGRCILDWRFSGAAAPSCVAATDTNGDAQSNMADAIYLFGSLFLGGPPPVAPFPECGLGTEADATLGCAALPNDCN